MIEAPLGFAALPEALQKEKETHHWIMDQPFKGIVLRDTTRTSPTEVCLTLLSAAYSTYTFIKVIVRSRDAKTHLVGFNKAKQAGLMAANKSRRRKGGIV